MAKTLWLQNDTGQYLKMQVNSVLDVAIDFINRLATGEEITTLSHTKVSGDITISNEYPFADKATHGISKQPHMAVAFVKPNALGAHTVKVTANTNLGRTFVYNYQVIATA
jgi:hypothetical protein